MSDLERARSMMQNMRALTAVASVLNKHTSPIFITATVGPVMACMSFVVFYHAGRGGITIDEIMLAQ